MPFAFSLHDSQPAGDKVKKEPGKFARAFSKAIHGIRSPLRGRQIAEAERSMFRCEFLH